MHDRLALSICNSPFPREVCLDTLEFDQTRRGVVQIIIEVAAFFIKQSAEVVVLNQTVQINCS